MNAETPWSHPAKIIVHLDTNFLIAATNPVTKTYQTLLQWLAHGGRCRVAALAWAEFSCGGSKGLLEKELQNARILLDAVVPMDETIAQQAASLYQINGRRPRTLADCVIAATALTSKSPLATINTKDFERFVPGGLILW